MANPGASTFMGASPQMGSQTDYQLPNTYGPQGDTQTANVARNVLGQPLSALQRAYSNMVLNPGGYARDTLQGMFPGADLSGGGSLGGGIFKLATPNTASFVDQFINQPAPSFLTQPFNAQTVSDFLTRSGGGGGAEGLARGYQSQVGNLVDLGMKQFNDQVGLKMTRAGMVGGSYGPGVTAGSPAYDAKYEFERAKMLSPVEQGLSQMALGSASQAAGAENAYNANTRNLQLQNYEQTRSLAGNAAQYMDSRYGQLWSGLLNSAMGAPQQALQASLQAASTPNQHHVMNAYSGTGSQTAQAPVQPGGGGGGGGGNQNAAWDQYQADALKFFAGNDRGQHGDTQPAPYVPIPKVGGTLPGKG